MALIFRYPNIAIAYVIAFFAFATGAQGEPGDDLIYQAKVGGAQKIGELLRQGVDPDYRIESGDPTALIWASGAGHLDVVDLLLQSGADANARDQFDRTALMASLEGESFDVAKRLLGLGVEINVQDDSGRTALIWAAQKNQADMVRRLLDGGAKLQPRDKLGASALLHSVYPSDVNRMLLDRGADVNVAWTSGKTPLMAASESGQDDYVALLLANGADADAEMVNGTTALILASLHGHVSVVQLLLDAGAKINHTNDYQHSALTAALQTERTDIVNLLLSKGAKDGQSVRSPKAGIMLSDVTEPAIPKKSVAPKFPKDAFRKGIEGWVVLEFDVGPKGKVLNPRIIRYGPTDHYNDPAMASLKKWVFEPASRNGMKVIQYNKEYRIDFNIGN